MKKTKRLRQLFEHPGIIRVVGAHDGLSAKLIEHNGFDAVWASGFEVSASYAVPDANILTMSQYLERACEMNDATTLPVIADCDTGYGNVSNVIHMVKKYEAAGIAAVCIEDKLFPKVNSFIPGRQELASVAEFVGKIMAAKNAQEDPDFMVIARVEALIAGLGMNEALTRSEEYAEAGADAILIHSKSKTPDEMLEFCRNWKKKTPIIVIPTTYPSLRLKDLESTGTKMVIYANQGIRASIKAMNQVFSEIQKTADLLGIQNMIVPMDQVFDLQGITDFKNSERKYLKTGHENVKVIIPAAGDPSYEESIKEIVKDSPIGMLDINGKSILERNRLIFNELHIQDITVITGYNAFKFNVDQISYITNPNFRNTSQADSIMLAEEKFNGQTIIAFSDIIFEKELIDKLLRSDDDIVLAIDSSIPESGISHDYVIAQDPPIRSIRKMSPTKLNRILKIGKNLNSKDAAYEFVGLCYFSKKGSEIFKRCYFENKKNGSMHMKGKNDFLEIIQSIIDQGIAVSGLEVNGGWMEIRNFENYKLAHAIFK